MPPFVNTLFPVARPHVFLSPPWLVYYPIIAVINSHVILNSEHVFVSEMFATVTVSVMLGQRIVPWSVIEILMPGL